MHGSHTPRVHSILPSCWGAESWSLGGYNSTHIPEPPLLKQLPQLRVYIFLAMLFHLIKKFFLIPLIVLPIKA